MSPKPSRPPERQRARLRERTRDLYREAILGAAERAFAERGFAGTRMADVAQAAGIATGTLYNYFENKQAVLRSLFELRHDAFTADLGEVYAETKDPVERIAALVRTSLEHLEANRAMLAIFHESGAMFETNMHRVCGEGMEERFQAMVAMYERAIAEAARAGRLRDDLRAADLAVFLTGAMSGFLRSWIMNGYSSSLSASAGVVIELFLAGARKQP